MPSSTSYKPEIVDVLGLSRVSERYREVVWTGRMLQCVIMCVKDLIPMETHVTDQAIVILQGKAAVDVGGVKDTAWEGDAVFIPAGVPHEVRNASEDLDLRVVTFYAPAEHEPGEVEEEREEKA